MKLKLSIFLGLWFAFAAPAQLIYLNLGTAANDGTGDKLRTGGISINTNFYWLSNLTATASNAARTLSYSIGTDSTNFTLAASNSVRLVAGLDATNHANGVLQSATNYTDAAMTARSNLNVSANTWLIPTNSALSNLTVNFLSTNTLEIYATNNLTFTNWSGMAAGLTFNKTILIRPQLITRGVNWGNLGLSNPGYSVGIGTNANNSEIEAAPPTLSRRFSSRSL